MRRHLLAGFAVFAAASLAGCDATRDQPDAPSVLARASAATIPSARRHAEPVAPPDEEVVVVRDVRWSELSEARLAVLADEDGPPGSGRTTREAAWAELNRRGEDAIRAMVDLALQEESEPESVAAWGVLFRWGPRSIPSLIGAAQASTGHARYRAVHRICILAQTMDIGTASRAVVVAALAWTTDTDADIAWLADEILASIPASLQAVAARLNSGSAAERLSSLRILYRLARWHEDAVELLARGSRDVTQDQVVRDAACCWLVSRADLDVPVDAFPGGEDFPALRLWALAKAMEEDAPAADVVAAWEASREAALAEFSRVATGPGEPYAIGLAVSALTRCAEDPVAFLVRITRSAETTTARRTAVVWLGRLAKSDWLGDHAGAVRAVLLRSASDAEEEKQVRSAAADALVCLHGSGTDVVAVVVAALGMRSSSREMLIGVLGELGAEAAPASDALRRLVCDPDEDIDVRVAALDALRAIEGDDALVLARGIVASAADELRRHAVNVVLAGKNPSPRQLDLARSLLRDPDPEVRKCAATRFLTADEQSAEDIAALAAIVAELPSSSRDSVAYLLRRTDLSAETHEVVLALLRDPDWQVRCKAAQAQAALSTHAERALPLLVGLLSDDRVVADAAVALGQLPDGRGRAALPAMLEAIIDGEGFLRPRVVDGIASLKEHAVGALPVLLALWRAGRDTPEGVVAGALARIGWTPESRDIARLRSQLDWDSDGRASAWTDRTWHALELLERCGTSARAVIPALLARVPLETDYRRQRLIDAIGHVASGEADVVAFLIEELRSGSAYHGCTDYHDVPVAAAGALGRIGPRAKAAVPALEAALTACEDEETLRGECINPLHDAAAAALESIRHNAEPASR